jgi:hypothetical protein
MIEAQSPLRPGKRRVVLWAVGPLLVVLVLAGVGLAYLAATSLSGTSLTKRDFADPTEATAFVSAHLPAPLPTDAEVEELTYDRFTDWHLSATVSLGSSEAVETYLRTAREQRQENVEYCGPWSLPADAVAYFLAEVQACGSIVPGPSEGSISVRCLTR